MSLYNMLRGTTQATFFILPMLGKHPDKYPRFRDCFLGDDEHPEHKGKILVYTRVGGGNRDYYSDRIDEMRSEDEYVTDYDDSFDSTYATFVFNVPSKFQDDFNLIVDVENSALNIANIGNTSDEYQQLLINTFPKLADKFKALGIVGATNETT
jgi:hypothetical protein